MIYVITIIHLTSKYIPHCAPVEVMPKFKSIECSVIQQKYI